MHTCIYITLALLFFSPFYTSSILLGRLADPVSSCQTHIGSTDILSHVQEYSLNATLISSMHILAKGSLPLWYSFVNAFGLGPPSYGLWPCYGISLWLGQPKFDFCDAAAVNDLEWHWHKCLCWSRAGKLDIFFWRYPAAISSKPAPAGVLP